MQPDSDTIRHHHPSQCCAQSTQLCPTLYDHTDCSPPGSSVHGDSPEYWSGLPCPPPGDLPNQGIEHRELLHCRWILYHLSHQGVNNSIYLMDGQEHQLSWNIQGLKTVSSRHIGRICQIHFGSEVRSGCKFCFQLLEAMWLQASYLTSRSYNFLIYREAQSLFYMEIMRIQ